MSASFNLEDRQSAAFLSAIIQTAIDGIVIIDHAGMIMTINPAAASLFGYRLEEVEGRNVNMLMPPPYHTEHDGYIERYQRTGEARIIGIGREVEGLRKDGSVFPLRLAVSEIRMGDDRFYAGFIHDLTNVKEAEQEIQKLNQELEAKVVQRTEELQDAVNKLLEINRKLAHEISERQAAETALKASQAELEEALQKEKELNELKSRFVSMASHEFRTPLSTILSSIALIRRYTEGHQQPKRDKHIKRVTAAVETLNGILNDFLSISKIEEGKIEMKQEPCRINVICSEVLDEIEGLLKKGQTIRHEDASGNLEIVVDRNILKNILFNLVSNAIKYSGEGKPIHCRTFTENGELCFEITDEGIGIPETEQKYLFSRFFRASNATNIQGTGLGLNIVAGYVDMLGGRIEFTSQTNEGSKFSVYIPIE
ncbi:MAG: PAS domain-containing sensor histidine kinase [Saprospiraceae bacterium]|nr:PAS domain-containing sensor histidine kinase [Saprospiraceae bacterium]